MEKKFQCTRCKFTTLVISPRKNGSNTTQLRCKKCGEMVMPLCKYVTNGQIIKYEIAEKKRC